MSPIRILLADDHQMFREGLRALFAKAPEMQVVAETADGREAARLALELRPDVVVMDVAMPELNGMEATRRIHGAEPEIRVVALSIHSDRRFVLEMLKAGASGYLLKDAAFEELILAVRTVAEGRCYLSSEITGVVVEKLVSGTPPELPTAAEALSGREREILQLLAEGFGTKEIAERLHISVKTVATHRHHIMQKTRVRSVAELTKYAIREGITFVGR